MSFEFDFSDFLDKAELSKAAVEQAGKKALQEAADDLARISSNIAPIDEETLRKSFKTKVEVKGKGVVAEVTFSATNKSAAYGRFNYALWTHEMTYNLGEQSRVAPGTDGYTVGNKYLSRPLYGEEGKYWRWVAEDIARGLKG